MESKERTMQRKTFILSLGSALAALLFALMPTAALAAAPPKGYTITAVAFLGDLAVINGISNEGVWLASGGKIIPIMRHGQPAPGGGTFSTNENGTLGLNDAG